MCPTASGLVAGAIAVAVPALGGCNWQVGYTLYHRMVTLRYASVMSSSPGIRNNYLRFAVKLC